MPRVVSRTELKVDAEDDVVIVRRKVRALAQERGFDAFATAAVTTAASELARNVIVHARRGQAILEEVFDGRRTGIRLTLKDEGPGIADMTRALAGGYSTARSLGLGLSGSKRLVDEFHLETTPGVGTMVRVVKWARY